VRRNVTRQPCLVRGQRRRVTGQLRRVTGQCCARDAPIRVGAASRGPRRGHARPAPFRGDRAAILVGALPRPVFQAFRQARLLLAGACAGATGLALFGFGSTLVAQAPPVGASAEIRDTANRLVATAALRQGRGEVLISIAFPNPPVLSGAHALHINAVGRCDPPDFASSGGIFNPFNKQHGRQNPRGAEVGDLPNVNFSAGLTNFNTSAIGVKNVSVNESYFQGHFPHHPVMPGVLIIESMAQTAAVLVVETLGPEAAGQVVYFMSIEGAKFRRPVVPGC